MERLKDKAKSMYKDLIEKNFQNLKIIEINKLCPAAWNYKTDNDELKEKLKNNIKQDGQIENVIIRELETGFYEVVNGNHRLLAMKELGFEQMICYNCGKISDAKAKLIAIKTNETKFEADHIKLAEVIISLKDEFTLDQIEEVTPFDKESLENFDKLLSFNWDELDSKKKIEVDTEDFEWIKFYLPKEVAQQFNEQVDRFKRLLFPEDKIKDVSPVQPIEAMCQTLHQVEDKEILGG